MDHIEYNRKFFKFIRRSPTQFHTVSAMVRELEKNNFIELHERDAWTLERGKRYFVTRNGSSIIAFVMGMEPPVNTGLKIAGAHTDSPCLKVKPYPELESDSMLRIGVEIYGGALLTTWFDRELNLAGRVTCVVKQNGKTEAMKSFLINYNRPVAIIPSLPIHLERNSGVKKTVNPQLHVHPLFFMSDTGNRRSFNKILLKQIKKEYPDAMATDVLGFDLYFSDISEPCFTGLNNEFISAPRLDNLISCHACLRSIINTNDNASSTSVIICTDNEEIGSNTRAGAGGSFFESVLARITGIPENTVRAAAGSFVISLDNAHAIHPSYRNKYDDNNICLLNQGLVLKINASGKYASDSETSGFVKLLCRQARVPLQIFVMRNDMACGSTIGPVLSSKTGIKTVDVGAPTLAMHSIRELTGNKDPFMVFQVLDSFFCFEGNIL